MKTVISVRKRKGRDLFIAVLNSSQIGLVKAVGKTRNEAITLAEQDLMNIRVNRIIQYLDFRIRRIYSYSYYVPVNSFTFKMCQKVQSLNCKTRHRLSILKSSPYRLPIKGYRFINIQILAYDSVNH